jgi:hypothetical protein
MSITEVSRIKAIINNQSKLTFAARNKMNWNKTDWVFFSNTLRHVGRFPTQAIEVKGLKHNNNQTDVMSLFQTIHSKAQRFTNHLGKGLGKLPNSEFLSFLIHSKKEHIKTKIKQGKYAVANKGNKDSSNRILALPNPVDNWDNNSRHVCWQNMRQWMDRSSTTTVWLIRGSMGWTNMELLFEQLWQQCNTKLTMDLNSSLSLLTDWCNRPVQQTT